MSTINNLEVKEKVTEAVVHSNFRTFKKTFQQRANRSAQDGSDRSEDGKNEIR